MKILSSGCYKGSRKYNGDIIGTFDNMCYVMDGSTAVFYDNKFFETSDLFEYMKRLNKNIYNNDEIKNCLKSAIIKTNKDFLGLEKYKEYELPTFTIGVVKVNDEEIELYQLCDILISILYKDGRIVNYEDNRINHIKKKCIEGRNKILQMSDISEEEKQRLLLENEQIIRKYANDDEGYPVGSVVPERIDQGISYTLNKNEIDKILICSDGLNYSLENFPSNKEHFEKDVLEDIVKNKLNKDKRDDLSYILIEI